MKTRDLVRQSLFAALIAVATGFLKIPSPQGYMHLGDGVIFASALVLGPIAAIPAAVGSALADLLAGYSIYIPSTVIIKGLLAFLAGRFLPAIKPFFLKIVFLAAIELALVLGGYFLYECLVYDLAAAVSTSLFTLWQCAVGVVIGGAAIKVLPKFKKQ